jgi:hypothetical protein
VADQDRAAALLAAGRLGRHAEAEVQFMVGHLFSGPEGDVASTASTAAIDRLPGLGGLPCCTTARPQRYAVG